nr:zinc-binding dehydrogenase [Rothia aerolata]
MIPEDGNRRLAVVDLEVPAPAANQAVVRIAYGGICGSDLGYWLKGAAGVSILKHPMILGHEVVGTVVVAAADGSGPAEGALVAVHPATPHEVEGIRYPASSPNLAPGSTYLGSAAQDPHTEGAFSQHAVFEARMLRELPAGLSLRAAALAEPAAVAFHAVERAGDLAGKEVLVIGSGPIGALVIAAAKRAGATKITATDLFDSALDRARELGANQVFKAPTNEEIAKVQADVVFESSGSKFGLDSALNGVVRGGRVMMVGMLPPGEQPVNMSLAIARELELHGCFRFNGEIDDVLTALADGSLFVDPVVSHVMPFEEAVTAFEIAKDSSQSCKVLLEF